MRAGLKSIARGALTGVAMITLAGSGMAQQSVGAVTNLELPRFVSMKTSEAFARRGPGKSHRIDWKFVHRNMPLKVVAEHGHWRQVEDVEGQGGWIHYALLSRTRSVLIMENDVVMHSKPTGLSRMVAKLGEGVVALLLTCEKDLCEIEAKDPNGASFKGWVERSSLWGLTRDD